MNYVSLGNPIWSCQFQILGGVRRLALIAAVYGALLMGATFIWFRADPQAQPAAMTHSILKVLAGLQMVVMVLGGAGAVHKALARDHTTRMMESLRLSPMSSFTVVFGYLFGATAQVLVLFVVGILFGAALAVLTGAAVKPLVWISGNFFLLVVSASMWSFVVFAGVGAGKPANISALIVILGLSAQAWIAYVPALGLGTGAYALMGCWHWMLDSVSWREGFGLAMIFALAALVFWCAAAARRFRRPYLPPLNRAAALILVVLAVCVSIVGLAYYGQLAPSRGFAGPMTDLRAVFVITLIGPLLFAHLPASMAVQARLRLMAGATPRHRHETWPPILLAILSAGVLGVGAGVLRSLVAHPTWGLRNVPDLSLGAASLIALAFLLAVLVSYYLIKAACFTTGKPTLGTFVAFLLWAAPPVMDSIRAAMAEERILFASDSAPDGTEEGPGWLFGCSPVGTVLIALAPDALRPRAWPGVWVQVGVIVLTFMLARRAERIFMAKRQRRLAAESNPSTSAAAGVANPGYVSRWAQ